jgi:hypothetical protein
VFCGAGAVSFCFGGFVGFCLSGLGFSGLGLLGGIAGVAGVAGFGAGGFAGCARTAGTARALEWRGFLVRAGRPELPRPLGLVAAGAAEAVGACAGPLDGPDAVMPPPPPAGLVG